MDQEFLKGNRLKVPVSKFWCQMYLISDSVYPHIADTMEECCSAIGRLIAFENVSANRKLSWGMHPICVAVKLNSTELVKFMLMRGADPNIMDSWDETPLSLAVILQNLEMIQLLIKGKANVNHMASITSMHSLFSSEN